MNKKGLFLGVGLGLIISSFIFFIVIKINQPELSQNNNLTKEEIILQAKNLGMIFEDEKQTESQTQKPTEKQTESQTQKPTEKQTESQTQRPTEKQTESQTQRPTEKQIESQTQKPTEPSEVEIIVEQSSKYTDEQVKGVVNVHIPGGSTAYKAIQILYDAGAIDNVDAFNEYVISQNKTKEIRAGYYDIQIGCSYEELLQLLIDRNR